MRLLPLTMMLPAALALAACDWLEENAAANAPPPATTAPPVGEAVVVPAAATGPADADVVADATEDEAGTETAEAAPAAAAAAASGSLGTTIASLGAAGEAGLWLKTPLVSREMPGRVVNTENGQSANVTLRPLGGQGGSQASLALMQALGAGLTDLPELEVFAAG